MPINSYLNQTVVLKAKAGFDVEGKPSLGAGSNIQARFQDSKKRLVNNQGNEFITDAEVWLKPNQTIALEDVIIYGGVNYKVVKIETKRWVNGKINHKKAMVIKTKE